MKVLKKLVSDFLPAELLKLINHSLATAIEIPYLLYAAPLL